MIRRANSEDLPYITHALAQKRIDFIPATSAKEDIALGRMFVIERNGKPIAQAVLLYDERHDYWAIKRMCCYRKENKGGIAREFLEFFCASGVSPLGCTPWANNPGLIHLLEIFGFEYQYTFLENYLFYKKSA